MLIRTNDDDFIELDTLQQLFVNTAQSNRKDKSLNSTQGNKFFKSRNTLEFNSTIYHTQNSRLEDSGSRDREIKNQKQLTKQIEQMNSWKEQIEQQNRITVLERPVERHIKEQYKVLLVNQKSKPFQHYTDAHDSKKRKALLNLTLNDSKGLDQFKQLRLPQFRKDYSCERNLSRGDYKLNDYL